MNENENTEYVPTLQEIYAKGIELVVLSVFEYCRHSNEPVYRTFRNKVMKDLVHVYDNSKKALNELYNANVNVEDIDDQTECNVQESDEGSDSVQ